MIVTADETLVPPPPTMASPSWWGADSHRSRARLGGAPVFVKRHTAAARGYLQLDSVHRATRAAAAAGIGPRVDDADLDTATLVLQDLTETHKTATLADLDDPAVRAAVLAARRAVWALDTTGVRTATVFDDIRALHARLVARDANVPAELTWMLRVLGVVEERIRGAGADAALIHGDANCSNVAIERGRPAVLLLDWDWAAVADPLQDVGSLLGELAFGDAEARELFEQAWGSFDEGLFRRARLYAAADAVRGGLLGAWADACDPGTHEYSKFSDWMFLRARIALGDVRTDDDLARMS